MNSVATIARDSARTEQRDDSDTNDQNRVRQPVACSSAPSIERLRGRAAQYCNPIPVDGDMRGHIPVSASWADMESHAVRWPTRNIIRSRAVSGSERAEAATRSPTKHRQPNLLR